MKTESTKSNIEVLPLPNLSPAEQTTAERQATSPPLLAN